MVLAPRRRACLILGVCGAFFLRSLPLTVVSPRSSENYVIAGVQRTPASPAVAAFGSGSSDILQTSAAPDQFWREDTFFFKHGDSSCYVDVTFAGQGPRVLLLPALSSISTRGEMRGLQALLASAGFETIAPDWPGLGTSAKRSADWSPEVYEAFLMQLLVDVAPSPALVVAAGHAAGYVLRVSEQLPNAFQQAVLVAPTWRGPVPTMFKGRRPGWLAAVRKLVDLPFIGSLFYKLNLNDFVIRLMARRHVYSEPRWLDERQERMVSKRAVTQAHGARHASIRFVTGALDPYESASPFLSAAAALGDRVLVIIGGEMPGRSRAEVDALMEVLPTHLVDLPRGRLGVHEEFPEEVAEAILAFANATHTSHK